MVVLVDVEMLTVCVYIFDSLIIVVVLVGVVEMLTLPMCVCINYCDVRT